MKFAKAPVLDGVVADTLKNRMSIDVLTALFNFCLDNNVIPSVWAKGIISLIPKNAAGNPFIPSNYRGISLLPVVAKIYSACISNRLSDYLEDNDMLCNEQNGLYPRHLCVDHIFSLHNICKVRKNLKSEPILTFIDFRKAFDCVHYDFL